MAHQFSGFAETYRAQKIHTECLRFEIINPSVEVAARLKIDEEDFVYDIIRVRYLNDEPVVIEYTKMPIQLIPGISIEVLLDSIYAYIEGALKLNIQSAHRIVRAGMPTPLESGYLRIEDGMPILEVEQTAFLDDGRPFEYSISRHRADKSAFKAVSVR